MERSPATLTARPNTFLQIKSPTRPSRRAFIFLVAVLLSACLPQSQPPPIAPSLKEIRPTPRLLENLGEQTHPISTTSPLAQRYFNQGLILVFGFNHEAAIKSFEAALHLDPECGLCHWGIALSMGPNINRPMGPNAAIRAYAESRRALDLTRRGGHPREIAYAEALSTRYANPAPEDRRSLDLDYANAMRALSAGDPSDDDAAILFAESLMNLYPWAYWTSDGAPREFTQEIVDHLEAVLARNPEHVGANHYYIHAIEEHFPERGVAAADRLGTLAEDAGHLVHMPSHIYWRVGRYEDAAEINQRASAADEQFFAWCRGGGAFYRTAYYPHNVHFLWAAAATEGQRDLALMTARKLESIAKPNLAEAPMLQEMAVLPILTMARFGLWDSILGEPLPASDAIYLYGISHYARGLAFIRTGQPELARSARTNLARAASDDRSEALILAGGTSSAQALLKVAIAHLDSEIAGGHGKLDEAVDFLRDATILHDALPYMEPPPWYAPPRQALGALLLDLGKAKEAEAVYLADLKEFPKNGWSLFGLSRALEAKGDMARAEWAQKGFEQAWGRADVELTRSSF